MKLDTLQINMSGRLSDGGPIYHETNLDNFFVEPWNAFSSLLIALPVIYFLIKFRGKYKNYPFVIYWCAPLLFIGGLGSALYHAFRISPFFLFMDVIPIVLLSLSVCLYFLIKVLPHWIYAAVILLITILLRGFIFSNWEGQTAINISYIITILIILIPAIIFLIKTKFYKYGLLILSLLMFIIAIFFRYADDWDNIFLIMGTHWLWHLFCSIGGIIFGIYLINIADFERSIKNQAN